MSSACCWVYILLCDNNTYYTGYTNNLQKRYKSHIDGTSKCKYTRSFKPIKIAQSWEITQGKAMAMKIERYIKKLPRHEKEKIIFDPSLLATKIVSIATIHKQSIGIEEEVRGSYDTQMVR